MSTALRRDRRTIAQRERARSVPCPQCGVTAGEPCYDGFQKRTLAWEHARRGVAVVEAERACPRCGGGGMVAGFDLSGPGVGDCPQCKGTGKAVT